jgi:hypothetical protein
MKHRLMRDKQAFLRALERWLARVSEIFEEWQRQIEIFSSATAKEGTTSQFEQALQEKSNMWTLNEVVFEALLSDGSALLRQLSQDPHPTAPWLAEGIRQFPGLLGECLRIFRAAPERDKRFADAFVILLRFIRSAKYSHFESASRLLLDIVEPNTELVERLFSSKSSGPHLDPTLFHQLNSTGQRMLSMVSCIQRAVAELERLKGVLK